MTLLGTADEALSTRTEHTVVVTITATLEHPFWVEGIGWIDAGDLETGDVLLSADGRRLVVQAAVRSSGPAMVYNFTVDALHTYTITELRVVVHNVNPKCFAKSPHRRHFVSKITKSERIKDVNTIVLPKYDAVVAQDIVDINAGLATQKGNLWEINGRSYLLEPQGTAIPVATLGNPAFIQLNRAEYKALVILKTKGLQNGLHELTKDPSISQNAITVARQILNI